MYALNVVASTKLCKIQMSLQQTINRKRKYIDSVWNSGNPDDLES